MKEAEDLPDKDKYIGEETNNRGNRIKSEDYENLIGKARAQKNRLMERLLVDNLKSTVYQCC